MAHTTITLKTATTRYKVLIGHDLLEKLPRHLKGASRVFLVTSPNIWKLWSKKVLRVLPQAPHLLFLPSGETHKRISAIETLAEQMAREGADRDSLLIALGGGVIGDMTGFLAAIYMRGIDFIQIPTTLLAQVDASVGGKTGVNLTAGKNLVGSFHQPRAVLADIDFLATLSPRQLRAGLQESVKAAIIGDKKFFSYLEKNKEDILARDPDRLLHAVRCSIAVKAAVVQADERESNLRMVLNFGHTLGHAIEAATHYRRLLHGEAVAWGSIAALHLALARRSITPAQFARMANLILAFGPLPRFTADAAQLVGLTAVDKKSRSGRRAFILPTAIGQAKVVHDVQDDELLAATEAMLLEMRRSNAPDRAGASPVGAGAADAHDTASAAEARL